MESALVSRILILLLCGVAYGAAGNGRGHCPRLQKPFNGHFVDGCNRQLGTECQVECRQPYVLVGSRIRVCQQDGSWSGQPAQCELSNCNNCNTGNCNNHCHNNCPALRQPESGYTEGQCNPGVTGQTCRFRCNNGYRLEGNAQLTCQSDGHWNGQAPRCSRTSAALCESLFVANGRTTCSTQGELTVCRVTCDQGYLLIGPAVVTCSSSGDWTDQLPSCQRSGVRDVCPSLFPPEGGRLVGSCTQAYTGDTCQLVCLSGYRPSDTRILVCQANGVWSNNLPRCIGSECPSVVVPYGTTSGTCNPGRAGQSCTITCQSGIQLIGRTTIVCGEDGRWSDNIPQCTAGGVCPSLPVPANGGHSGFCTRATTGQTCSFSCMSGYTLSGSPNNVCLDDGTWSSIVPTCVRSSAGSCPTMYPPVGGYLMGTCSPGVVGQNCLFGCDADHVLVGDRTLTCLSSGMWSRNPPICENEDEEKLVYCKSPGLIENGQYTVMPSMNAGSQSPSADEFIEMTRLVFTCNEGYSMTGSFPTLHCQHNKFWSSEMPFCNLDCGYSRLQSLGRLHRGVVTDLGEWPWTVAISKLSNGFSKLSCGGSLLDRRTVLTAAHCLMDPDLVDTGVVRLYFGKYYRSNTRDDDEVVQRTPSIFITHPHYDAFTKDNDIALILFEPPINYTRRIRPVCLPTKESSELNLRPEVLGYVIGWGTTERNLVSEELKMARVPVVPGPQCKQEFEKQNISMLITRNMFCAGFPEGRVASCTGDSGGPIVFHDPQTDRHTVEGIVSFGRHRECGMAHRYTVYTQVSRYLDWIKALMAIPAPTIYCDDPGIDPNGNRRLSLGSKERTPQGRFVQGTKLIYGCRVDYRLQGQVRLSCLSNGSWSDSRPSCQSEPTTQPPPTTEIYYDIYGDVVYCSNPGKIDNGNWTILSYSDDGIYAPSVDDDEFPVRTRIKFFCDDGYSIVAGFETVYCQHNGFWSRETPLCHMDGDTDDEEEITYCLSPGPISNGRWTVLFSTSNAGSPANPDEEDEFPETTRLLFDCDGDFKLVGSTTMHCEQSGFWSSDPPYCIKECGRAKLQVNRRIPQGIMTEPGEWPWTVAIATISSGNSTLRCGGSLLDNRTVLTAAHCLLTPTFERPTDIRIYFGKLPRSDVKDNNEVEIRKPSRFIVYPEYNTTRLDNDIALIRFEPPIKFSDSIQPVCLPTSATSQRNLKSGNQGYVLGWDTAEQNQLRMAPLHVMSTPECKTTYASQNISWPVTNNTFCAGHQEGRAGSCIGDSGGSMVFYDGVTDRYTIEGILSFWSSRDCSLPNRYTAFTKVYQYLYWIDRSIRS